MDTSKNAYSRRKAVQLMGVTALGMHTLPLCNLMDSETPKEKLGVALVGLGNYSTRQLGPALKHTQYCELKGIVTGTPEKAERWAKEYNLERKNIYNYDTFDQLKNNPAIDIVYVVLPNFMHAEYTIRAAQAGKHVICEKPMAMNVQEGKAMIAACNQAKRKLQVGYRLYYHPYHNEAIQFAKDPANGGVKMMEASLGFSMADPKSWRLNGKLGGGGAIVDLGVYAIQAARRMVGQLPMQVRAKANVVNKAVFKDIYESFFWQLEFPNGTICNSSSSYSTYVDRCYLSMGSRWFELMPAFNAVGVAARNFQGTITQTLPPFQQIAQMDDFARSILENKDTLASGEEGLIDLQILKALFESIEAGHEVAIDYE